MRIIGMDIHGAFAEVVALVSGSLRRMGRVDMRRDLLEAFARTLGKDDIVVVEATGNASAVAAVIGPHVKRIVIANPKQVRIRQPRGQGAAHLDRPRHRVLRQPRAARVRTLSGGRRPLAHQDQEPTNH